MAVACFIRYLTWLVIRSMHIARPPTIDSRAALRWANLPPLPGNASSPWLNEEVARRMEERLQWIVKSPQRWLHWEPLRGGLQAHALLTKRYQSAQCFVHEGSEHNTREATKHIAIPWWNPAGWCMPSAQFRLPTQPVQMLWANMALHMDADPQALIARWHALLEADGFLMFSCLGPDTLRELRRVYAAYGWPPPAHEFTDMHDWGDMLVAAGFAEPVMDAERISLSFASPARALLELRELGRNLHVQRFQGLRGRHWLGRLHEVLQRELADPQDEGQLKLSFEIIYGHAFKPMAKIPVRAQSAVSLEDVRAALPSRRAVPS